MYTNPGSINILTNTSYALHSSSNSGVPYPVRVYSAFVKGLGAGGGTTTIGTLALHNAAIAGTEFVRLAVVGTGIPMTTSIDFSNGLLFPNGCWAIPSSWTAYSTITYEILPL